MNPTRYVAVALVVVGASVWPSLVSAQVDASPQANAARLISSAARALAVPSVPPDWTTLPEVQAARLMAPPGRAGLISAVLDELDEAEKTVFDTPTSNEALGSIHGISRVSVLAKLRTLLEVPAIPVAHLILQDYLDGEIADLKLVAWKRLPNAIYMKEKDRRDSKRSTLIMQEREVVKGYLLARQPSTGSPATLLARRLLMVALLEACTSYAEGCARATR